MFLPTQQVGETDLLKTQFYLFYVHFANHEWPNEGSGPTYLCGWITAFCFWDEEGKCFHKPEHKNPPNKEEEEARQSYPYSDKNRVMVLNNVRYHIVNTKNIPPGYATVPIKLDDNGYITYAQMVAGEPFYFL